MDGTDLAKVVSTKHTYVWETGERSHLPDEVVGVKDQPPRFHVVAYDFGIKHNIMRKLRAEGCKVTVVPAQTKAEDVIALKPNGVFLSNGPGDPEPCTYAVDNIRRLMGRCRSLEFVLATNSPASRLAAKPTSSNSATTAAIIP